MRPNQSATVIESPSLIDTSEYNSIGPTSTAFTPNIPTPSSEKIAKTPFVQVIPKPILESTPLLIATATPSNVPNNQAIVLGHQDIRSGGILKVATHTWFKETDVHREPSHSFASWGPGISYSRLLRFSGGSNIKSPSMRVECDLCVNWSLKDSKTLNFTIRTDVKWHLASNDDIGYLTAHDISFSLNRQRTKGWANSQILHMIDSIEATSDSHLNLTLKSPDADVFAALANGKTKIISQSTVSPRNEAIPFSSADSGAWTLESVVPGTSTRMVRSLTGSSAPYLDAIEFTLISEPQARLSAFAVGLIDIHRVEEGLDYSKLPSPKLFYLRPGSGIEMAFNTSISPFNELELRKAAMYAISPNELIDSIWNGNAFFSLGFPVASPNWLPEQQLWSSYFEKPNKAKIILENSSAQLPIPVQISSSDYGTNHLKSLDLISSQLSTVGFDPSIAVLNRRTYANTVWRDGNYQILIGPTFPQTSPNGYLLPVLHSKGAWNTVRHSDQKLDQLIQLQAAEYKENVRTSLIQKINKHVLDKAYRFMPATKIESWIWSDTIQRFNPNFVANEYSHWERIWKSK